MNYSETARGNVAFHYSPAFHLHGEFLRLEVKLHTRRLLIALFRIKGFSQRDKYIKLSGRKHFLLEFQVKTE